MATLTQTLAAQWAWVQAKVWLWAAGGVAGIGLVAGVLGTQFPPVRNGFARRMPVTQDDYRIAGFPDAARVHAVIAELQTAVARGDVKAVAVRVRFPLRLNSAAGAMVVPDAQAFATDFDRIFPFEIRSALAKCPRSALFSSAEGVMIGSGDLWLAPAGPGSTEPRLSAINLKSAAR